MSTILNPGIKIIAQCPALQQMCNYVAIAETKSPAESLRELILHTLFTFGQETISSVQKVADILKIMFGVDAPNHQVQEALDQLISAGEIHQPLGTNYVLTADAKRKVKERIDRSVELQKRVRMQWLAEMIMRFPDLNVDLAWDALQDYLAKAFLRHGIQVAIFLDPSIELPPEYAASLSTLLTDIIESKFDSQYRESAKKAISDFLASVGKNQERAKFIAECADGAANYFSLAVSADVAERFRGKLSPITLFCDTNFLFGILDLHVHPLVEVSNELLKSINTHQLQIKLRYHEATLRELQTSISHYDEILRRSKWTQALSRAATTSRFMSGIELKYHQKNAETGVDVDAFMRPYQHVDVLLTQHGISIYKPSDEILTERATLEAEYGDYLRRIGKIKPYELIAHDVAVLACTRFLKRNAATTLDTGALFVTCDYRLYRFDCDESMRTRTQASVVLPNMLWQILRPFIPANQDFDRSFAETFAIPEFRTIGSDSSKACSKMLGLLAAYKDFPEETAARLLSNDLLIDRLRATQNDDQFQAQVESAIASDNQTLLEERAALAMQVETLRVDKERTEKELKEQKQLVEVEITKSKEEILKHKEEMEILTASYKNAEAQVKDASVKLAEMTAARNTAEKDARHRRLVISAVKRSFFAFCILLFVELIIVYLASNYGLGQNLFQRITNAWPWLVAGFGAVSFLYPFFMGRERMRLLKWWQGESD